MANNTIMTAKNTFGDGLLMDFAPDNTQATCLTNALNATLVTMNGNELSLLNDMGNGRVETAYLPEGYVPVGTCEFGDIIYIAAYNPLTNKSLIGCFPSPERNISSEELINSASATLKEDELLIDDSVLGDNIKTGEKVIKTNSIKKIIYENKLNSGDKFIVYSKDIVDSKDAISDFGNTDHIIGKFPKLIKLHIVAIEDSGKINYLDSDLVWYTNNELKLDDYFINTSTKENGGVDIDSYRTLLLSGYSIFNSKISGKLAILIEFERINDFNCTYLVSKSGDMYNFKLNYNWDTPDNNINPQSIKIRNIKYGGELLKEIEIEDEKEIKKDIVITIPVTSSTLESKLKDKLENSYLDYLEHNYDKELGLFKDDLVYGLGNKLTYIDGMYYIDLQRYEDIVENETKTRKYYNTDREEIHGYNILDTIVNNYYRLSITKLWFSEEFKGKKVLSYDIYPFMSYGYLPDLKRTHTIDLSKINSGEMNLTGYRYYNGADICTLLLDLELYPEENKGIAEVVLEFYDNQGICATYHIFNRTSYSGTLTEKIPLNGAWNSPNMSCYHNNQLILHKGIENNEKGVLYEQNGEIYRLESETRDSKITYYENDAGIIYSNFLYAVKIVIKYCPIDALGNFDTSNNDEYKKEWRWLWTNSMFNDYYYNTKDFENNLFTLNLDVDAKYKSNLTVTSEPAKKSEVDTVFDLKDTITGSITSTIDLGLTNNYDTFALYEDILKDLEIKIYIGNLYVTEDSKTITNYNGLLSNDALINKSEDTLKYAFNSKESEESKESLSYIGYNGETQEGTFTYKNVNSKTLYDIGESLNVNIIKISKYIKETQTVQASVPVVHSLIHTKELLENSGLGIYNNHFYFKNIYTIYTWCDKNKGAPDKHVTIAQWVVDSSGSPLLPSRIEYGSIRHAIRDNDVPKYEYGQISGYWQLGGDGSASSSQLKNGNYLWFYNAPSGSSGWYTKGVNPMNNGFFLQYITTDDNCGFNKINASGDGATFITIPEVTYRFKNQKKFILLGFYSDSTLSFHLLNDMIVYSKDNLTKLADRLGLFLDQIYIEDTSLLTSVVQTKDILYYKPYSTHFVLDVVYQTNISTNLLNNILILRVKLGDYLEAVIGKTGKGLAMSDKNVNVGIKQVLKNIPITINVTSRIPNIELSTSYVLESSNYTTDLVIYNKLKGFMCILNDGTNNNLTTLPSSFYPKLGTIQQITKDTTTGVITILSTGLSTSVLNKNFSDVFLLLDDNTLQLKNTKPLGAPNEYSFVTGSRHSSTLNDLSKKENIFSDLKFMY